MRGNFYFKISFILLKGTRKSVDLVDVPPNTKKREVADRSSSMNPQFGKKETNSEAAAGGVTNTALETD